MSRFSGFSPDALSFLRALKRNNRREWFQPRKEKYEALIKAPMLEFVAEVNEEMARFAPAYVTSPAKAVYRIYRDTRFSPDKTPYKTHIAAIFPRNSALKREGAVFYLHFTEKELLAFGGVWGPDRDELLAYRTLLQQNHEEFQSLLNNKSLDHPAEGLLRQKQWYLESTLPISVLTTPRVVPELAKRFAVMAPMVEFLNRPFAHKKAPKKMLFMGF
jgi:uncharacterized protein (DUF2461 family)